MAGDRLSNLCDDLLCCQILSRLPLTDAIRSSALSKRYIDLWRQLPRLRFDEGIFGPQFRDPPTEYVTRIIDNILRMHSCPLEVFMFRIAEYYWSHKVYEWISIAAQKGATQITLHQSPCLRVEVPSSLFQCLRISNLCLVHFKFTYISTNFAGFGCLATLKLQEIYLSDQMFESLVRLCPVLENLKAIWCSELRNLKICSNKLKCLSLENIKLESLTADCPQLVNIRIRNCSNSLKMELNLPACINLNTNPSLLEQFTTVNSLRKVTVRGNGDEEIDANTLSKFHGIQQLCIWNDGFFVEDSITGGTVELIHLEKMHVHISTGDNIDLLLSWLLKSAPAKTRLRVTLLGNSIYTQLAIHLFNLIRHQKRVFLSLNSCHDCEL